MGLYFFLMVQMIMILVMGNLMMASMNGRALLYRPFEYLLPCEGARFLPESGVAQIDSDYNREEIENICQELHGNSVIHMGYGAGMPVRSQEGQRHDVNVHGFEEAFLERLNLPLQSGSWEPLQKKKEQESRNEPDTIPCVISSGSLKVKVGDILETEIGDIRFQIVGVLTALTYEPSWQFWAKDVSGHFRTYLPNEENLPFIVCNSAELEKLEGYFRGEGIFIEYDDELTARQRKENDSTLLEHGIVMKLSTFRRNSETYLYHKIKELIPIMIGGIIIISISIVNSVSIIIRKQMRQMKIYYLCGASEHQCRIILIVSHSIMLLFSLLISTAILCIWNTFFDSTSIGLMFDWKNILLTGVLVAIFGITNHVVTYLTDIH